MALWLVQLKDRTDPSYVEAVDLWEALRIYGAYARKEYGIDATHVEHVSLIDKDGVIRGE